MRSFRFCALIVLVLAGSLCASGQTLPPITADDQMGFQPFNSYHGGDIDHIGLANGTLNLDSEFLSYSQRGNLRLDFHLYYNNNPQHTAEFCVPNSKPANCFFWWGWTPAPGPLPLEKGDVFVGWAQQLALNGTNMNVVFNAGYSDQFQKDYTRWSLQTADGAMHTLGNLGTMSMTGSSPEFFASYTGPWETLDATSWRLNGALTTTSGQSASSLPASGAVAANGTVAGTQDANGNVIATTLGGNGIYATGFTDTLGRSISAPPTARSSSNTGTSACPSGALPVDHAVQWSVSGPNGGTSTFTFCYVKVSVNIPPGPGSTRGPANTSPTNLQSIVLPDGHSWSFQYNDPGDGSTYNGAPVNYGTLTQITLPTGGTISYTYTTTGTGGITCQNGGRFVVSRTVNANDGTGNHTWTYAYVTTNTGNNSSPWSVATTVTDPLGNQTVHTFNSLYAQDNCPAYEAQTQYYQGSQSGGTLLKTVNTAYSYILGNNSLAPLNVVPTRITTTWAANGLTTAVSKSYDSGYTYSDYEGGTSTGIYGKELSESASDYAKSNPPTLKITNTNYLAFSNSNYLTANLLDLVSSQQITDGSGNQLAKTTYGYDESSLQSSGVTTQLGAPPNSVRGNLTSANRWLNTNGGNVTTTSKWYDSGEVYQSIDALQNPTTHNYDLAYAGAYSTKTTNALSETVSGTYDFNTGLLTSFTDANGSYQASGNTPGDPAHTTTLQYNDPMWRLTQVQSPPDPSGNHPVTTINYPDANTVERLKTITSGLTDDAYGYFDGVGRHYKAVHVTAGNATVVTTYDADGRTSTVTNAYITTNDPTYGVTTTQYDGIGRATKTTKQDNSAVAVQYNQTSSNSPNGDCTLTTDEAGHPRKACLDGLGRLIEVDEPQASSGSMTNPYVTLYTYDALGNLLSVNQKGDGSQAARTRTFTYDSLSRLLTATNPESGQISYSYDADGNVLQKTSPAPNQTGSATQTISYCYDKLNRVTGRAYSAQSCPLSSPIVTYSYDSGTNGVGHLTGLTDQAGSGSYSYDALDRISSEQRTIANNSKTLSYTYNLDNSLATLTYPSGAVVTYTPDAAGRVLSAVDSANNINYITGATYGPDNSLTGFLGGQSSSFAGITNSFSFNPRLQPVTMAAVAPDCTGTGCKASVSISGGLQMAASSSGVPAPNAATNSAITTFEDSDGVRHWAYLGANQHLYHISWSSGNGFAYQDLTVESGAPAAAAGSALTSFQVQTQLQWWFLDSNNHVDHVFCGLTSSICVWEDFTAATGAPAAAPGSALTSFVDSSGYGQHLGFVGTNQHVYEAQWVGGYGFTDLTAASGAPLAAAGSTLTSFQVGTQWQWWFLDGNHHVDHVICASGPSSCGWEDFTAATGAPAAAPGSALTSFVDSSDSGQHLGFVGTNQHVYEAQWVGGYGFTDLTAASGAPPTAVGSTLTSFQTGTQWQWWFFDGNHHLDHVICASGPSSCSWQDFTTATGAPVAAPGSTLSSFVEPGGGQYLSSLGTNQHVYEAHWTPSSGYGFTDLNAATPAELADSGTVSLNVGAFTGTACFGSSNNPACTGQPVNDNPSQVAAALATALNASGSPVTASASGPTITMTWTATGSTATPVSPLGTTHDNPTLFPAPSFTSQAASFGGGTGGTLPVFNITYNFNLGSGDNGNVIGISNNRDTTRSQSFTYDFLNRLTSAQNSGTNCNQTTVNGKTEYWGNSYGYDPWGNLLQKNVTKCSAENLSVSALSNNQLSGYGYDAAGNMTHDATTNVNYSFDAENRITGAAGYTYTYDADGNRVEKSNGSTGTIYWYMSPGIVAESDISGNLKSEYVFFDGERVARKDFSGGTMSVAYYFSDHLKTASVITNSAGVITEDEDYYPWGGELQFVNSDSNHYKFTSKERDAETGLDYFGARYYGNWYGRFLSADWAAKPEAVPYSDLHDPQSLNLYSYVRNIPTSKADSDGHQAIAVAAPLTSCGPVCWGILGVATVGYLIYEGYQVYKEHHSQSNSTSSPPAAATTSPQSTPAVPPPPPPPGQGNKGKNGSKKVPNPNGKKGGPAHQGKVGEVEQDMQNRGLDTQREYKIDTPNGEKSSRFVDVVGKDEEGSVTEMHQVGKQTQDGQPVAREDRALNDIQQQTGDRPNFHPYNDKVKD